MNLQEAIAAFRADLPRHKRMGLTWEEGWEPRAYLPDGAGSDLSVIAQDAQPTLVSAANAGIPWFLANFIDPQIYEVLFAPMRGADILGEQKRGDWTELTAMFPFIEHTGEVTSYGDYAESGSAGVNANFPQRQNYIFQTFVDYGDREVAMAGLAKINLVNEKERAAVGRLNKYQDLTYHFGVANLQTYGLMNDPNLTSSISPAPKAAGHGNVWMNGTAINATANEVYNDITALFAQLVSQTAGLVEQDTAMVLALSPNSAVALTATNSFNVNVADLVKKNFPNIKIVTDIYYSALSSTVPQGNAAGNLVQLFAVETEGQRTGYCAFSEKMRSFPIVRLASSYRQKRLAGTYGAVIRMPANVATMVGV